MLFQVLDHKRDCIGYFADNQLHPNTTIPLTGSTWEMSEHMLGETYELGRIYSQGAAITDVCPKDMALEWQKIVKTLRSCLRAFQTSKVSLDENCFYDLIPEQLLFEFLSAKNRITEHVLSTHPRPNNYDSMLNLNKILVDIKSRPLNVNINPIKHLLSSVRGLNFHRTLKSVKHVCDYNPWGTKTGRLATNPKSFPILTMNKGFRGCVAPQNDWFIELDFNAAELRVLLALSGELQPEGDIHDWNVERVFNNELTREEAKVKTFAWLYSNNVDTGLEALYDKKNVQNKYWDGFKVETDYGRIIKDVDSHHALNYVIQSTTIDMVHEQAYKIFKMLKGKKSYITFLIHDAIYIDLADEDRKELLLLLDTFRNTRYGMFKVNTSAGKNLGNLKELKL